MEDSRDYSPIDDTINVLLAEDDYGDQFLFEESLSELPVSVNLTTVGNGEDLIQWLHSNVNNLPDVLFLDLQLPRKNGLAALKEIKRNPQFDALPVFVITTNKSHEMIKRVYLDAAHYCIFKPIKFEHLKYVIYRSLKLVSENELTLPDRKDFVLTVS